MQPTFNYRAVVRRVVDADTVDVMLDLGFTVHVAQRLRLYGLDAPEIRTAKGREARDTMRGWLPVGQAIVVTTFKTSGDKYGRWLAIIHKGDENINEALLAAGLAKAYDGGAKG